MFQNMCVIDPGHGGLDSGTNGVNDLLEKDLVLAEGLKLAKALRARDYVVHLTRDSDAFVPLPERVAIARKLKADLMNRPDRWKAVTPWSPATWFSRARR